MKTLQEKIRIIQNSKRKCIKGYHKYKVYYYKPNIPFIGDVNETKDKFKMICTKCLKKEHGYYFN